MIANDNLYDCYADLFAAVAEIYSKSIVGGPLHIVLDDGNLDDDSIRFCLEDYRERSEGDRNSSMATLVDFVGERLLLIDDSTREKLYEMRWTNSGSQDR